MFDLFHILIVLVLKALPFFVFICIALVIATSAILFCILWCGIVPVHPVLKTSEEQTFTANNRSSSGQLLGLC